MRGMYEGCARDGGDMMRHDAGSKTRFQTRKTRVRRPHRPAHAPSQDRPLSGGSGSRPTVDHSTLRWQIQILDFVPSFYVDAQSGDLLLGIEDHSLLELLLALERLLELLPASGDGSLLFFEFRLVLCFATVPLSFALATVPWQSASFARSHVIPFNH